MQNRDLIFTEIIQQNHGSIYRICKAYLYDRSHADDLYQEILLQIWKSMSNYKGNAQISTWIYRVAVNTAISYNAQHKKNRHEELPENTDIPEEHGTGSEKEMQLILLNNAISQLEEHDRLIISLVLENLSYKEIAEITGSNINNTGVRIARIKARLLRIMENKTTANEL